MLWRTVERPSARLDTLIHKIHETYNVTQVIVTADHGFLFNDKEFKEKDKFPVEEEALEKTTRYYLTNSEEPAKGVAKYRLSDVSGMEEDGNIFVAVPEGTNRFNAPSGGYMFTHGGASLEEMIIPVLISQHERVDTKQSVGVFVLDQRLSVQASRLRFKAPSDRCRINGDEREGRYMRSIRWRRDGDCREAIYPRQDRPVP